MASYKYDDNDLEFLRDIYIPDSELRDLFELLGVEQGKTREYMLGELQSSGGNSVGNFFRGGGVKYREILCDVCDKISAKYNKKDEIEKIEEAFLEKILQEYNFAAMTLQERKEFVSKLNDNISDLNATSSNTKDTLTTLSTLALGPIGLVSTAVTKSTNKKTESLILQVALLRLKFNNTITKYLLYGNAGVGKSTLYNILDEKYSNLEHYIQTNKVGINRYCVDTPGIDEKKFKITIMKKYQELKDNRQKVIIVYVFNAKDYEKDKEIIIMDINTFIKISEQENCTLRIIGTRGANIPNKHEIENNIRMMGENLECKIFELIENVEDYDKLRDDIIGFLKQ